jgi:hypothetical protein
LKKPTGSIRFRFYKPETKKIKPNWNKPSQTEKNRAKQSQNQSKQKKPS